MSVVMTIVGMALVTYLPRLLGFILSGRKVSAFWLRFLHFVPITVFAAIVAPSIPGSSNQSLIRVVAATIAGLVLWRFKRLWIGIVVGMSVFWLLRAI